jgi:hypothetical protein
MHPIIVHDHTYSAASWTVSFIPKPSLGHDLLTKHCRVTLITFFYIWEVHFKSVFLTSFIALLSIFREMQTTT